MKIDQSNFVQDEGGLSLENIYAAPKLLIALEFFKFSILFLHLDLKNILDDARVIAQNSLGPKAFASEL